jgi:hypothetical protein
MVKTIVLGSLYAFLHFFNQKVATLHPYGILKKIILKVEGKSLQSISLMGSIATWS